MARGVIASDHLAPLPSIEAGAPDPIEVVDQVRVEELELAKFMEEPVEVVVAESSDENATPMVEVAVNGRRVFIPRGQPTTVKRMYVERLARARRTSISQNLDPRLGEGINVLMRRQSLDYPFAVTGDSDKGKAWLKAILSERV